MNKRIYDRVIDESNYIIETGDTIRNVANIFGVSKSTVHKDIRERLLEVDKKMYDEVSSILQYHVDIKHIRGGESTKRKFLAKKTN